LVAPNEHQSWDSVPHFFSAAASAMRRILIDNARKKQSLKRGGDHNKVEFSLEEVAVEFDDEHLIRLDEALAKLAEEDPVKAKLIELRFFGGLTVEQSCEALGISRATANRYWNYARAWLFLQVSGE
jgi:RNA polymerase sigma factor (TIGR02999 family)